MTKAASTPRVRAYRERRRLGVRCVKVAVSKTVIEALVRMTYLPEDLQQDVSAIQKAVQTYVADASCRNRIPVTSLQPERGFALVDVGSIVVAHPRLSTLVSVAHDAGRSPKIVQRIIPNYWNNL